MGNRLRPSLALLISALVHAGIAFVLIGHANRSANLGGSAAQTGPVLTVTLVNATRPALRDRVPATAVSSVRHAALPAERSMPATPDIAASEDSNTVAGGERPREHHYFGAGEVTELPVVAEGLAGGNVLVVPGFKPQTVALEVWVSDEGLVDRVELETPMAEADRELLLAAFAKVRFLPGRIGRIAVHSRLSLRILVDYTLRA